MNTPLILVNQTFNKTHTYNPDRDGLNSDGLAVCEMNSDDTPLSAINCVFDGEDLQWGYKASFHYDSYFTDCIFRNGTKRSFDQVRGGDIYFNNCIFENKIKVRRTVKSRWDLPQQCDMGIKAGVRDVILNKCFINDILLGDYSIYDQVNRPKTRRLRLIDCVNPNGGPIIIRGRWFDKNSLTLIRTSASVLVWPEILTKGYFLYNRKFGDKRIITSDEFVIHPEERV